MTVILSWLLAFAALIYTFVETSQTDCQFIDLGVAAENPFPARYPDGRWTPENWYAAVLDLLLMNEEDRRVISGNLSYMETWRWTLIALFILGLVLMVLVVLELLRIRRDGKRSVSMVEALSESPNKA